RSAWLVSRGPGTLHSPGADREVFLEERSDVRSRVQSRETTLVERGIYQDQSAGPGRSGACAPLGSNGIKRRSPDCPGRPARATRHPGERTGEDARGDGRVGEAV